MQFRTTHHFLRTFGLTSLDELPELPSASQEGTQLTLDLESAIAKMQEDEGEKPSGEA